MPTIYFTLLGTGTSQGVPVIGCDCAVCTSMDPRDQRLRTSAFISSPGGNIAIDCGPDFRQQMLREEVHTLDAILLTHEHNDHIIGMDDVRPFNFSQGRDMPVYCSAQVARELRQRFAYIFASNKYPGAPQVTLEPLSETQPLLLCGLTIQPIPAWHGALPILGFRIGDLVYLTDIKTLPEKSKQLVRGASTLLLSALHHAPHHSHLNLTEALALVSELAIPSTYLIHISHRMGLHAEVSATLPEGVALGYDGLQIAIR